MSGSTLSGAFERCSRYSSRGVSVVGRGGKAESKTWREVAEEARRIAGGLRSLSLLPGERVALIHGTGFDFIECFFGCVVAGVIPVPLYPPVRLGRLDEYHRRTSAMLRAVGASLLLCDSRTRRILGETVLAAGPRHGCLTSDRLPAESAERGRGTTDLDGLGPHETTPDDICLIQFSSGTTVEPKPVMLTHRAVMAQVRSLNGFWPDCAGVRHSGVSWLPLYHDMGLIGCLLAAVERPGDLTLIPPELFVADPAIWLRTLSSTRATISPAPNFAYGLCVDKIRDRDLTGVDLSAWRVALNGAEVVVGDVARAFVERFSRWGFRAEAMTPVYGLSEAALAVTFSEISEPIVSRRFERESLSAGSPAVEDSAGIEIVSVGRPLPGFELSVRCGDAEVEDGVVGRVWVRGPSVMAGYFGNETATAAALSDGWLDTGDLGFCHEGELFLTGRAKDVLILRGRNHMPHDIERAVDRVDGARTGCSVAVSYRPDGATSEQLLVLAERRADVAPSKCQELAARCREAILADAGLEAGRIEILEPGTLPRTSSGKIRRQAALEAYLKSELQAPDAVTPVGLLGKMMASRRAMQRASVLRKKT